MPQFLFFNREANVWATTLFVSLIINIHEMKFVADEELCQMEVCATGIGKFDLICYIASSEAS